MDQILNPMSSVESDIKRFRCRVCYDASERPAFVDFSWTFANPLPVTPKVYKVGDTFSAGGIL